MNKTIVVIKRSKYKKNDLLKSLVHEKRPMKKYTEEAHTIF